MYGRAATSLLFSKKEETKPYIMFGFGEVHESREESRERPKQATRPHLGAILREARRREPRPRRTADSLPGGVRRELLPVRRSDAHHARHLPADRRRRLRRGSRMQGRPHPARPREPPQAGSRRDSDARQA